MRCRVAIVDDHEVVRLAVAAMIAGAERLELVGQAETVAALLDAVPAADLVILDLSLRDKSSPEQNVAALQAWGAQVMVLTSGEHPFLIREASRSSVLGIVRKSAPAHEILAAIEKASRGEAFASTEWAAAVDSDPELGSVPLTPREREVLTLYASGLGAKAVAWQLGITENTVDDHIRRIRSAYQRVGRPANTKVEMYQRSLEDGFLPVPFRD